MLIVTNEQITYERIARSMDRKIQKAIIKDKIIDIHVKNKYSNMRDLADYIGELTSEKLKIAGHKRDKIMEVIDSPVQRAILTKERTIRKKTFYESKKVIPQEESDEDNLPINLKAKIYNDSEFRDAAKEELTPDLISAFVAKQAVNSYRLTIQCKELDDIQSEKKERLSMLNQKLQNILYFNNSSTEGTETLEIVSKNLRDPKIIYLDKLKKQFTERKQLIANTLSFMTRISHQLEKYGTREVVAEKTSISKYLNYRNTKP